MEMFNLRITLWIVFLCCFVLDKVKSETERTALEKNTANRVAVVPENKSQPEKRDSRKQEGTKSSNHARQYFYSDEPFIPIYRPEYTTKPRASTKNEHIFSQAVAPQAETYYDKPLFINGIRYDSPSPNDGSSTLTSADVSSSAAAHPTVPLIGSYLSSVAGVRHASDAYRGPNNPTVYQKKLPAQKQATTIVETKVAPVAQKVKGVQQYNLAYDETGPAYLFNRASKSLQQKDEQHQQNHQQRLLLQHPQYKQPYIQFYDPYQSQNRQHQSLHHQQFNARAAPQHQQQQQRYLQYIIAIPQSYARQLQHQLAIGGLSATTSSQHEAPLSTSKTEAPAVAGPLARDHYGSYRPAHHYTSNYDETQYVAPAAEFYSNPKPQYTTQYIQVPASLLHAAFQAAQAHAYQNRQNAQGQHSISYQQPQPQYTYNTYQQQQSADEVEQEQPHTKHHTPIYVQSAQEKPHSQKTLQEAIIHIKSAKPSANNTPVKTYKDNNQIPSTPTSTTPFKAPFVNSNLPAAALAETAAPIVHYNPIYMQGPPPEQPSLHGVLNYHRFAMGGLHGVPPAPVVRLLSAPSPHGYHYSSLPQHLHHRHHQYQQLQPQLQSQLQPFHTGLEHKTIYGGYASEQIPHIAAGLQYFSHPGAVHYGTHLYHPATALASAPTFLASPSIPAKVTETENRSSVSNQHQQPEQQQHEQQQQHSLYPQYASDPSKLSLSSLLPANISPTADRNAGISPIVKYP